LPHRESCSVRVVSHHLDGLLRSELAGLLHPAADPGVRRVSELRLPHAAEAEPGMRTLFPATHTPWRTYSSSAVPRHRGRCLPAVTSPAHRTFSGAVTGTRTFPTGALAHAPESTLPPLRGIAWDGRLRGLAPSTSP
jgi:hypothetical protein